GQLEGVALGRAAGVARREQVLAAAALLRLARPLDGVTPRGERPGVRAHATALRVDRDDDRLRAEPLRELADQRRPRERGRVHADLVRSRLQQALGVVRRTDASA